LATIAANGDQGKIFGILGDIAIPQNTQYFIYKQGFGVQEIQDRLIWRKSLSAMSRYSKMAGQP
jgi:hypothetical protein